MACAGVAGIPALGAAILSSDKPPKGRRERARKTGVTRGTSRNSRFLRFKGRKEWGCFSVRCVIWPCDRLGIDWAHIMILLGCGLCPLHLYDDSTQVATIQAKPDAS